jgi:hypothetical protein
VDREDGGEGHGARLRRLGRRGRPRLAGPGDGVALIAAVLIRASVANSAARPTTSQAPPGPVDVGCMDGVEVLAAAHRLHARMVGGVAGERPSGGRAAGDEQRGVGGDRGVASCNGGIEQDVPEPGRAVVDRGDAERGLCRVGHPDRDGVADVQATSAPLAEADTAS